MKKSNKSEAKHVDHDMFLNKDGMSNGGVEVEVSKPTQTHKCIICMKLIEICILQLV